MIHKQVNEKIEKWKATSYSTWSTIWMMHPPPSHGRIKYPLGNISALTKDWTGGIVGPFCLPVSDRSQICNETSSNKPISRSGCNRTTMCKRNTKTMQVLRQPTTKLPSSKIVVYLRVQKSRAGAKVVGAYICHRTDLASNLVEAYWFVFIK